MKKPVMSVLSLALCAVFALSGAGALAYAADEAADSAAPAAADGARNEKDETVYVLAQADGSAEKIIVSDWLRNARGDERIHDVTRLTDIENVKGDEAFTPDGPNAGVWDARGNDVYYQGVSDEALPVSVSVSYTLNGQPIAPDQLAGKSGRVVIRFDYTNHAYEMVDVDGRQEKIFVPFAMLTGVVLENDVFSNISVSNGKIVNDGDRTVVAGLAFPGLRESLGLEQAALEIPEFVEITADAQDFALETTFTLAANGLLREGLKGADGLDELEDLNSSLDALTDAMDQLMDGSAQLYDGLCTLLARSGELTSGADRLTAGASGLRQGADSLSAGAGQLQTGADALCQGLNQLTGQNDALNGGAAQVFQSLLAFAGAQLAAAGVPAPELTAENYAQVLDGVLAAVGDSPAAQQVAALKGALDSYNGFYQGLQSYTAGVAQASAGAGELSGGIASVKGGADSLSAGAGQLYDGALALQNGASALVGGVTQLRDGALELSNGLQEFNREGVQKLVDAVDGDLNGLVERLKAVKAVSERYTSFSGISDGMDGQVKFVWRTEAVG